jgi:hypothetical protein
VAAAPVKSENDFSEQTSATAESSLPESSVQNVAAEPNSLSGQLESGYSAWTQGDRDQAFGQFFKAAEIGSSEAQLTVGMMYGTGEGVGQNYDEALKWITKALEQGNLRAQQLDDLKQFVNALEAADFTEHQQQKQIAIAPPPGPFVTPVQTRFKRSIPAQAGFDPLIPCAPPKVQSALLEAMQERQVTLGGETHPLEPPFLVLATQNPIEQEGTYPLPEAQVDRFMLKLVVRYPGRDEEKEIIRLMAGRQPAPIEAVAGPEEVFAARREVNGVYMDEKITDYIVDVVRSTRHPDEVGASELRPLIHFGASPRASIYLAQCTRALAFLRGRDYVLPEDVKELAPDVLRHRVITTFEAEAEEVSADDIVRRLLEVVRVP